MSSPIELRFLDSITTLGIKTIAFKLIAYLQVTVAPPKLALPLEMLEMRHPVENALPLGAMIEIRVSCYDIHLFQ